MCMVNKDDIHKSFTFNISCMHFLYFLVFSSECRRLTNVTRHFWFVDLYANVNVLKVMHGGKNVQQLHVRRITNHRRRLHRDSEKKPAAQLVQK